MRFPRVWCLSFRNALYHMPTFLTKTIFVNTHTNAEFHSLSRMLCYFSLTFTNLNAQSIGSLMFWLIKLWLSDISNVELYRWRHYRSLSTSLVGHVLVPSLFWLLFSRFSASVTCCGQIIRVHVLSQKVVMKNFCPWLNLACPPWNVIWIILETVVFPRWPHVSNACTVSGRTRNWIRDPVDHQMWLRPCAVLVSEMCQNQSPRHHCASWFPWNQYLKRMHARSSFQSTARWFPGCCMTRVLYGSEMTSCEGIPIELRLNVVYVQRVIELRVCEQTFRYSSNSQK